MALIPQDATATRKLGAVLREAPLDAVTPTWRPLPRDLLALSGDGALHARGVRWEERGEAVAARGRSGVPVCIPTPHPTPPPRPA